MHIRHKERDHFVSFSAELTGFDSIDLLGTGMVDGYLQELRDIVGARHVTAMLRKWNHLHKYFHRHPHRLRRHVKRQILNHSLYGPIARGLIKMWYLGSWYQLPEHWRAAHGTSPTDVDHVISPDAYKAGLAWRTCGAHPMGARQPGFATWSQPPCSTEA